MADIYLIETEGSEYCEVYFPHNTILTYYIRQVPSAVFDEKSYCWRVETKYKSYISELCDFAKGRHIVRHIHRINDREEVRRLPDEMPDLQYPITHMKLSPYDYQRKGIQYMVEHRRCINGDDMGLGKTFQSIGAVSVVRGFPCLVVCPAAMKVTWQREFQRFIGKRAVILDNKNKDNWHKMFEVGTCNVFITNYESVKKFCVSRVKNGRTTLNNIVLDKRMALFKTVIIDESQRCCRRSALWSLYLEAVCKGKEYVWLLTGTPIILNNEDLVQQLRIMDRLDDFGGARKFRERYCQGPNKSSNLSELHFRLWDTCYFRRDKSLVLKELPEKTRQYLQVEISNEREYRLAERDLIQYLSSYSQMDDEKEKKAARATAIVQINHLRQISARGKMHEAKKFIDDVLSAGHKLIIFAFHKAIISEVMKLYPDCVCVTGSDSQEAKQASIDKFQNDPDCKLIALNYKSGGVGITLTAASRTLFIEFPWTSADCEQAECRAHRNGQKNAVDCYYLLAKNTIDERILDVIQRERHDAGIVTGAPNDIEERMVDLALDYYREKEAI